MRKIIKLVLLTVILGFASLFLAALISFLISQVIPGDPVLAYLPDSWTQPQYDIMYQILGLNQPIIIQFFRYISNMLTGNWGLSLSISRGFPVYDLIMNRIPLTFCRIIIPLIVGLVLGFVFGNYSMKFKSKKGFRTVQILSITGFVIPFILLNILSQFFILNLNLMVLWILLTISVTALTILLSRIYLDNLSKEASRKRSNTIFILLVGASFGIIFLFLIQTELLSFGGIGELLLQAFSSADYYVINVIIFLILFSFPIFIIFSLFSFFLFGKIKSHYNLKK
ncbi:MAG: hypothetical protein JSV62_08625 [Promethearchaeota archaeon]|nr:MAG: hypothetical protein JSV62_08625 [Candidatus Lokiarchaeota archaeon]